MTFENAIALLGALTALLGAIAIVLKQLGALRQDINGRLSELLDAATQAARKDGELAGRDYVHRMAQKNPAPDDQERG